MAILFLWSFSDTLMTASNIVFQSNCISYYYKYFGTWKRLQENKTSTLQQKAAQLWRIFSLWEHWWVPDMFWSIRKSMPELEEPAEEASLLHVDIHEQLFIFCLVPLTQETSFMRHQNTYFFFNLMFNVWFCLFSLFNLTSEDTTLLLSDDYCFFPFQRFSLLFLTSEFSSD